jgi:thymidylate synthase (FAD)
LRIVKPSVFIFEDELDKKKLSRIERYGRVCYKSEAKITPESSNAFVKNLISHGHLSVLEHEKVSVIIVCNRGVSHEIVRHRVASFSQQSTRYCDFTKDKFGSGITFIDPFFFEENEKPVCRRAWEASCQMSEDVYRDLREYGAEPQEAREVLPNATKTEIVVTADMREWRLIFGQRCSRAAHPQMRQIMLPLLWTFKGTWPALFDDIAYDTDFPKEYYAEIIIADGN